MWTAGPALGAVCSPVGCENQPVETGKTTWADLAAVLQKDPAQGHQQEGHKTWDPGHWAAVNKGSFPGQSPPAVETARN